MSLIRCLIFLRQNLIYTTASMVLLFSGFSLLYYDQFLSKLSIHPDDIIGVAVKIAGQPRRKNPDTYNFRSLHLGDPLGIGDSVFTDQYSRLSIDFINGTKLMISPNSYVVLKQYNEKIQINIKFGELEIEVSDEDQVNVTAGEENETLKENEKGKVKYDPNGELQLTKNQTINKSKTKINELEARELTYEVPHPKNKEIILRRGDIEVLLITSKSCRKFCELALFFKNRKIRTETFSNQDDLFLKIPIAEGMNGVFSWIWTDGANQKKGSFEVYKYNDEAWKRSLKKKQPIDIRL